MSKHILMRQIAREDIQVGTIVLTVEMPYETFVAKFGQCHSDHPPNWDAPAPVELWFFRLPWGLKITLEFLLGYSYFNVYVEALEIEAVLDYLNLKQCPYYLHEETLAVIRAHYPIYTQGLAPTRLYRQDDNGNTLLIQTYESRRVADYYQRVYEERGHKQLYWVE